jgi:hypothetical protein
VGKVSAASEAITKPPDRHLVGRYSIAINNSDRGRTPMRFFHFKDLGEIEAFIFASDADRARELFMTHVGVADDADYAMIWRELELHHFAEPFRTYLKDGLKLEQEGIGTWDDERGWVPVVPLASEVRRRPLPDD